MVASQLSKRIFSLTALAFPLTLYVPMNGSEGSGNRELAPERQSQPIKDLENESEPEAVFSAQDAAGEFGHPILLRLKADNKKDVNILSIKLVCAQGGLLLSDNKNTYFLDNKDHVIDISSWDLSKITVTQIKYNQMTVNIAFIVTYNTGNDKKNYSYVKDISIQFKPLVVETEHNRTERSDTGNAVQAVDDVRSDDATYRPTEAIQLDISPSEVFVGEAPTIAPLDSKSAIAEQAGRTPPISQAEMRGPGVAMPNQEVGTSQSSNVVLSSDSARDAAAFVERAKALIGRGDISGARRLLEHARVRNARGATLLLAQTYDPERLRAWNVRGLRADPDLARSLYTKAADQERSEARLLAARGD